MCSLCFHVYGALLFYVTCAIGHNYVYEFVYSIGSVAYEALKGFNSIQACLDVISVPEV